MARQEMIAVCLKTQWNSVNSHGMNMIVWLVTLWALILLIKVIEVLIN